jgi:Tat protein secretion system quality control protein TatD with DNase activity
MSDEPPPSSPSDEETPEYPTSEVIQNILSTTPPIPSVLRTHLHDAHCHPTDHPETLSQIDSTSGGSLCAMSTRPNDQSLVATFSQDNPNTVIPFFGYHPWFAHLFAIEENGHYETILKPSPPGEFLCHLPKPLLWEEYLQQLRNRLESNTTAQVGEIGLDKSFRLPTHTNGERDISTRKELSPYKTSQDHQLRIFIDQCKLAGEFGRAVSVHGVQCHGLVFSTLQSLWKGYEKKSSKKHKVNGTDGNDSIGRPFPPRICIHSSSLPVDTLKQYLQRSVPSTIYFSFSTVINARYGQKLLDLIVAVPDDRILIESDWHSEGSIRRNQLQDIARVVISTKKWSVEEGIEKLERNFRQFVYGNETN